MNVAALQKHIGDLAGFVSAAGGTRKLEDDLLAVQRGLEPFAEYRFEDFAAFLTLAREIADEFRRTGQVPVPPQKSKRGGVGRKPAAPKISLEDARVKVRLLYEQAPTPAFQPENLDGELASLNPLTVADLKIVAGEAESAGTVKSLRAKKAILDAIRKAILDRRGTVERVVQ